MPGLQTGIRHHDLGCSAGTSWTARSSSAPRSAPNSCGLQGAQRGSEWTPGPRRKRGLRPGWSRARPPTASLAILRAHAIPGVPQGEGTNGVHRHEQRSLQSQRFLATCFVKDLVFSTHIFNYILLLLKLACFISS
jgi:hypothetical protein